MTKEKGKLKSGLLILICSLVVFFAGMLSACGGGGGNNIFQQSKVDKFIIGQTKAPEVTEALGQPYEKNNNNVWCWYEDSYINIDKAMIKAFEDLDEDKLIKLDQDLENLTFKFIMIRFEEAKVAEVFLDMNHKYDLNSYFESASSKQVQTLNLDFQSIDGYTLRTDAGDEPMFTFNSSEHVYSAIYNDGSYYSSKMPYVNAELNAEKTQVAITFDDDVTSYSVSKTFNNKYVIDEEGTLLDIANKNITELVLDENVVKIPMEFFAELPNLVNITYAGTKNDWVRYHGTELTYHITCSDGVMGTLSQAELDASPFIFEDNTGKKITGVKDNTMEEIIIPYYVEDIERNAFAECTSAKRLIIYGEIRKTLELFENCPLEYMEVPDGFLVGSNSQFKFNKLKEVVINNFIYGIYGMAHYHTNTLNKCYNLESISIADYIKYNESGYVSLGGILYTKDFEEIEYMPKALKNIVVPKSWTSVPSNVYYQDNRYFESVIFEEGSVCETLEFRSFYSITKSFIAPESLKNIESKAIGFSSTIETLYLPAGLETCKAGINGKTITLPAKFLYQTISFENLIINAGTTEDIENYMSSNPDLTELKTITVLDGVADLSSKDNILYNGNKTKLLTAARKGLGKVTLSVNVEEIGDYAFYGSDITELDFDNRLTAELTTIGEYAFGYCYKLKRAVLPKNLETIGNYAFVANYILLEALNLSDIKLGSNYDGDLGDYVENEIKQSSDWVRLSKFHEVGDFLVYLESEDNTGYLVEYIGNSTELVIPSYVTYNDEDYSVEVIGNLFKYTVDYNFTKITVKYGAQICESIFVSRSSKENLELEELIIEDGVTFVRGDNFSGCKVKKATIPISVMKYVRIVIALDEMYLTGEGELTNLDNFILPIKLYLPSTITSIEKYGIASYNNINYTSRTEKAQIYYDGTMEEFKALAQGPLVSKYYYSNWDISIYCNDGTLKYITADGIEGYNSIELGENEYLYGLAINCINQELTFTANMFAEHEYLHDIYFYHLSESVTIEANTFNGCDELKYIFAEAISWNEAHKQTGWDNGLSDYEIVTSN